MTRAARLLLPLGMLALASGCHNKVRQYISPSAYSHWTDRVGAMLGLDWVLFDPCQHKVTEGSMTFVTSEPADQCFRFSAPTKMKGVWISEFEGSAFYDGAARAPAVQRYDDNMTWLEMRDPRYSQVMDKEGGRRTFVVGFIGRRSLYPALYGHMGMSRSMVIVDRVLSMHEIPGPTRIALCDHRGCHVEPA